MRTGANNIPKRSFPSIQPKHLRVMTGLLYLALLSGCWMLRSPPPGAQNWPFSIGPQSYHVALGDLDGDGDLDAYLANGENEVPVPDTVWLNDGQGRFSDSGQQIGGYESRYVLLVDLDLDGDLDALVTGTGDLDAFVGNLRQPDEIWLNAGGAQGGQPGTFVLGGTVDKDEYTRYVELADLDSDGDLDAFVVYRDMATVWLNDGSANFTAGQQLTFEPQHGLALGDLNGNGHVDVFAGSIYQDILVWFNDGAASFTRDGG